MGNEHSQRPRKRTLLWVCIPLACILLLLGMYAFYRLSLSRKVEAKLEEIRAAGYPVTLEELDEWYPQVPPGENAAEVFLDAFANYVRDRYKEELLPVVGGAELPPRGGLLPDEMKKAIVDYLSKNEDALRLLHEGAAMKRCRYPVDLTGGLDAELPHLKWLRHGACLLKLESILHAENGEADLAARSVASSLKLARSLAKEPILISLVVRTACREIAISGLERVLTRTQPADEHLVRLGSALAEAEDLKALSRAVAGERSIGIDVFTARENAMLEGVSTITLLLYKVTGAWARDIVCSLDVMSGWVEAAELALPERIEASADVGFRFDNLPKLRLITLAWLPALDRAAMLDARHIAWVRAAVAALAVERYRLAKGTLPEKLADLVPEFLDAVPEDPFDGKPLRYRKLETGYIVYSIGEDGTDDGGASGGAHARGPDITFSVER